VIRRIIPRLSVRKTHKRGPRGSHPAGV
jgi:hypothetical protein